MKYERLGDQGSDLTVKVDTVSKPETSRVRGRVALGVVLVVVCLCVLLATCVLVGFIIRQQWKEETRDFLTHGKTLDGHSGVRQSVKASVEQNTVEYFIDTRVYEKTWIIDDFNINLEIIKSVTEDRSVCYVSQLNLTEATPPSRAAEIQPLSEKKQHHSVLTPDFYPVTDRSFLGAHGRRMCEDVDVYWLHPMDDVIELSELNSGDMNTTDLMDVGIEGGRGGRSKRNIRGCLASCCWLVCCCDVHHFKWERTERFSCHHVCGRCTKAYKQKIQKIC